jgi:NADH dehydrogenase
VGHSEIMDKKRILIIGGGFGGVKCAKALLRDLPPGKCEIVLFNRENHLVFSPLLADAVGSSVNPLDVIVPLRQLLPDAYCRTQDVRNIFPDKNEIEYEGAEGGVCRMRYDHLVLACGNVANLNVVPGMADHSFALKNLADAAALRTHIMEQMEKAEVTEDPEKRAWHLSFIVVGGGYSGVEAAGEINDLVRSSACYFRNFQAKDARVVLIHSRDQLLPEIGPSLREFAREKMQEAGVKIILNARVTMATPEGVGLPGGEFIRGATIVCTVGSSPSPLIERLNAPKDKGRLQTEPDMRVRGLHNVWAIGDCANIINAFDQQPSPPTGQFAERQGKQCAANICRVLDRQPTEPFRFRPLGQLCSIGGHSAVAEMFGLQLSGFLAWFAWRGVYLFKLPTWARRFQLGFDWAWLVWFPRDLSHVRTSQTDRVTHAHYEPGNYIFKQGEPASFFYIIEDGEVEVSRTTDRDPKGEVLAVLGPGSFFGERALLDDRPRVASARARTTVNLTVMGRNVFTQVSKALGPLRDALAQALNRRGLDIWKNQPQAYAVLKGTSVTELMDPVPQPLLKPTMTLREVGQAFVDHTNEFFYVSSDGQTLEGVVTMTDLIQGQSSGATANTPLSEIMSKNPVALSIEDTCATVANALREYRLKTMPIVQSKETRKLAGCVRARKLMGFVMKRVPREQVAPAVPQLAPVLDGQGQPT